MCCHFIFTYKNLTLVNSDRKALFIRRKVVLGKIDPFKLPEPTALKNVLIV